VPVIYVLANKSVEANIGRNQFFSLAPALYSTGFGDLSSFKFSFRCQLVNKSQGLTYTLSMENLCFRSTSKKRNQTMRFQIFK
jgi:hypothetical protein